MSAPSSPAPDSPIVVAEAASLASRGVGRRAVLGLALLTVMSGGAAALLYGSIEPGVEFAADPDAARRNLALTTVRDWVRLETLVEPLPAKAQMVVVPAADVVSRKLSAAQKLVEAQRDPANGGRRLLIAAMTLTIDGLQARGLGEQKTLDELVARGVDGILLDVTAAQTFVRREGRSGEDRVLTTLFDLVERGRQLNPGFLFVIENAGELAADPRLLRAIDAVAHTDLLFGIDGAGKANGRPEVAVPMRDLERVRKSGRPVFVTERLDRSAVAARAEVRRRLAARGFVIRFAPAQPTG